MRARPAVLFLAAAAACGSSDATPVPQVCKDACDHIFLGPGDDPPGCGVASIQVTDPNGGPPQQLDRGGCEESCRSLDRRDAFRCVDDLPDAVSCDAERISGCLSFRACEQTQLAVGGCYGADAGQKLVDPESGCVPRLSAWKECIRCVSGKTCALMRGTCDAACQVSGGGGGGAGGSGGGGAGGSPGGTGGG